MESLIAAAGLVFLAELGDKTQLVALGFGARYRLAPVLAGLALAFAAANLVSVVVGGLLGAALPTRALGIGGGILFLGFAAWTLRTSADDDDRSDRVTADRHVVASVAIAVFVAELGDKTMLATATLAAQGSPILVWVGATAGIVMSGSVGVLVGRATGRALPERAIRVASAALFAAFGIVLVVTNVS